MAPDWPKTPAEEVYESVPEIYRLDYAELLRRWREVRILQTIDYQLEWDEQTYMPKDAAEFRGIQHAFLAEGRHARMVDEELSSALKRLMEGVEADAINGAAAANVREAMRLVDIERKLPVNHVKALAAHRSIAGDAWREAKQTSNFGRFAPALAKMIQIMRERAEYLGYENEPYEALFAEYEPGISVADVDRIFAALREKLVPFVQKVVSAPDQPDSSILYRRYPIDRQEMLSKHVLERMGFDLNRGRLDVVMHPFCESSGPRDVRLTTRYKEHDFGDAVFGAIHEGGHGLYDQGIAEDIFMMPIGAANSLGLHESQSRFWEVWIGRSLPFWHAAWPVMQALFPDAVRGKTPHDLFRAVNKVEPSFIRVDADPVTYNLHILLRYELERKIVRGEAAVGDLPSIWNEMMERYVGIVPPDDAKGVLQDVHWSFGLFGYFPTYTLGNIASAAIYRAYNSTKFPYIADHVLKGNLLEIREWLRENIHQYGCRYSLKETLARVGGSLDVDVFMGLLTAHMEQVYGHTF